MSLRSLMAVVCLGCLWVAVSRGAPPVAPTPATTQASGSAAAALIQLAEASSPAHLAGESLTDSARSLGHLRDGRVPARPGRIAALLELAQSVAPKNPLTLLSLAELYEARSLPRQAAGAYAQYLQLVPDDYAVALRYLQAGQAGLEQAQERADFLRKIFESPAQPSAIRALAGGQLAQLLLRQADPAAAGVAQKALELDPYQASAWEALLALDKGDSREKELQASLQMLQVCPRSYSLSWRAAQVLQAAGLHQEALKFLRYAFEMVQARQEEHKTQETVLVDLLNAMLDAGLAREALDLADSKVDSFGYNVSLRALAVEAARSLGLTEDADNHIAAMVGIDQKLEFAYNRTPEQTAEVAWFLLHYRGRAAEAVSLTRSSVKPDTASAFALRVAGAAELGVRNDEAGIPLLEKAADRDAIAAATLARWLFLHEQNDQAVEVIKKNSSVRTGPGWRELAALAKEYHVELPPPPSQEHLRSLAAAFPAAAMEMGRHPEKFLQVSLAGPAEPLRPGQGVEVTAELRNISDVPVYLGSDGLVSARLCLSVTAQGGPENRELLLVADWPAPRVLPAGQSVRQRIRLDLGAVQESLAEQPLQEFTLKVDAVLDGAPRGQTLVSSTPTIVIPSLTIHRSPLYANIADEAAAHQALVDVVAELRQGDLPAQMLAARQVGALLSAVRQAEQGKSKPLPKAMSKPVLLSMLSAVLSSPSPEVRSETLSALGWVDLDEKIIGHLAPAVQDPSPLVRIRLIELLAGKKTPGHQPLLEMYQHDPDPAVKAMAAALAAEK